MVFLCGGFEVGTGFACCCWLHLCFCFLFRHTYRQEITDFLLLTHGADTGGPGQTGPYSFVSYLRRKMRDDTFGDLLDILMFCHMTNIVLTVINVSDPSFPETRILHDYGLHDTAGGVGDYFVAGALLWRGDHFNVAGELSFSPLCGFLGFCVSRWGPLFYVISFVFFSA